MAVKIQMRRGTAQEWASANPVLMEGEIGVDATNNQFRIGDGTANWGDLPVAGMTDGSTMIGGVDFDDNLLKKAQLDHYREKYSDHGTGGNVTIDVATAHVHRRQLNANTAITLTNPGVTERAFSFTLLILQDAGADRSITWPASVKWGGDPPDLPEQGKCNIYTFYTVNNGTRWYGLLAGANFDE